MAARVDTIIALAKAAAPTALALLGVLLLIAPLRLFEGLAPTPILPLVVIFFWAVYAPDYIPAANVFFVGLIHDLLTGGPLGLWALVYLMTLFVVSSQRSYFFGREQKVVWLGFAFAAAGAGAILWLVMSLIAGAPLPVRGLLFQLAATVAVYPPFAIAFRQFHHRVLREA